jgi:predicted nucleotidyltransferase
MDWYEKVLSFLESFPSKSSLCGAIAFGSYVTGNPSEYSDIDLHLVLDKSMNWAGRGKTIIRDTSIDYAVSTPNRIRSLYEEDFRTNRRHRAVQFSTGEIIFDEVGEVEKLKREANWWLTRPFIKPDSHQQYFDRCMIWDNFEKVRKGFEQQSSDFELILFNSLSHLVEVYFRACGFPVVDLCLLTPLMSDRQTKKKYLFNDCIVEGFSERFLNVITSSNRPERFYTYSELVNFTISEMGGYDPSADWQKFPDVWS